MNRGWTAPALTLALLASLAGCAELATLETEQEQRVPSQDQGFGLAKLGPVTIQRVVDGDTVIVEVGQESALGSQGEEVRVRLLQVDAPESVKPDHPVECFGPESAQLLGELLPEGSQAMAYRDVELLDQYGRALVFLGVGSSLINRELIERGAARVEYYRPNLAFVKQFQRIEQEARQRQVGRWGACR